MDGWDETADQRSTGENAASALCDTTEMAPLSLDEDDEDDDEQPGTASSSRVTDMEGKARPRLATCRLGIFPFPHAGLCRLVLGACAVPPIQAISLARHSLNVQVPRKRLWRLSRE